MRYKVGDKVVMRSDLDSGEYYGGLKCSEYMEVHAGDVVEIVEEDRSDHTYKTEHWFWLNDRMIDHPATQSLETADKQQKENINMRFKVGDKVKYVQGLKEWETYDHLTFRGYREDPVLTIGEVDSWDNTYRVKQGSWGRWVSAEIVEAVEELAVMPQWFDTWFKTYSDTDFGKGEAIFHLSRAGRGDTLVDWYENEVEFPNGRRWSSNYADIGNGSDDKGLLLLVDAVINGYVVEDEIDEEEPLYYIQFVEGSRDSYLNKDIDDGTFNTMNGTQTGSFQTKFTEAEIKEINPAYWELRVPVKEG